MISYQNSTTNHKSRLYYIKEKTNLKWEIRNAKHFALSELNKEAIFCRWGRHDVNNFITRIENWETFKIQMTKLPWKG